MIRTLFLAHLQVGHRYGGGSKLITVARQQQRRLSRRKIEEKGVEIKS